MKRIIGLLTLTVMLVAFSACTAAKGSILITESLNGTACTMSFSEWTEQNKCELSLNKNDELNINIARESGDIALVIRGKNGKEAYTGSGLESGAFTVTVSEADTYVIKITGKGATGSIAVKKLPDGQ